MVRRRLWLSPVATGSCIRSDDCAFRTCHLLVLASNNGRPKFLEISHALGVAAHRNYIRLHWCEATLLPHYLSSAIGRVDARLFTNAHAVEVECTSSPRFVSLRHDSSCDS